jgi:3-oxoacyl-[acyl-carrier protein] reductase
VRAVFVASQAAAAVMTDHGRIISIGSNLADRIAFPGLTLYTMSKTALIGLTKGLARDLGPRGITVNLVQPGSTDTDMNPEDGAHADAQRSMMAIPRFGTPQDVAGLVSYLAGPEARSITGAAFTIDGGFNA